MSLFDSLNDSSDDDDLFIPQKKSEEGEGEEEDDDEDEEEGEIDYSIKKIEKMPIEIMISFFLFLNVREQLSFITTSKRFFHVLTSDKLWRSMITCQDEIVYSEVKLNRFLKRPNPKQRRRPPIRKEKHLFIRRCENGLYDKKNPYFNILSRIPKHVYRRKKSSQLGYIHGSFSELNQCESFEEEILHLFYKKRKDTPGVYIFNELYFSQNESNIYLTIIDQFKK